MNWLRFRAALIRGFWTVVFPLIGGLVNWLLTGDGLHQIGVENASLILAIGGVLYALKKLFWPDTTL